MKTETQLKDSFTYTIDYPLICAFLTRSEGFRNDCLRQYCVFWRDGQCLFVAIYESIKKVHREP